MCIRDRPHCVSWGLPPFILFIQMGKARRKIKSKYALHNWWRHFKQRQSLWCDKLWRNYEYLLFFWYNIFSNLRWKKVHLIRPTCMCFYFSFVFRTSVHISFLIVSPLITMIKTFFGLVKIINSNSMKMNFFFFFIELKATIGIQISKVAYI